MIDLEDELRGLYTDIDADDIAAERIRAALAARHGRRSSGWVVGAAVTAVFVALGAVALRAHDRSTVAAGVAPASCATTLPAQWRRALDTTPITVDGEPAHPLMLTAAGGVIVASRTQGMSISIVGTDGAARTLVRAVGEDLGGGYAFDGDTLVIGPTNGGSRMVLVDVRTGTTRTISLEGAMPAGYIASDGIAMSDGVIYFGASPRRDGRGGVILGYQLATGTADVVARTDGPVFVRQDARGVLWKDGEIRLPGTPSAVPDSAAVFEVHGDGPDYAWNVNWRRNHEITWTDGTGAIRSFTVRMPGHPGAVPIVLAVSGPYVLLTPYSGIRPLPGGRGQLAVLDTRTGAVANLGVPPVDDSAAGLPTVLAFTNAHDATLRIDTSELPQLRC